MTLFTAADISARADAADFVGRIAQLDPAALIRMTSSGSWVDLWAKAGFGVIAHRRVAAMIEPNPLTSYATNLIAALAVSTADSVDTGSDASASWIGQLPPAEGWVAVGTLPTATIGDLVAEALPAAQQAVEYERLDQLRAKTKATVPASVLDRALVTMPHGGGLVPVSMRMLFALSGMGFDAAETAAEVTVSVTATWLRLATPSGSVARRRMADLPLTS